MDDNKFEKIMMWLCIIAFGVIILFVVVCLVMAILSSIGVVK